MKSKKLIASGLVLLGLLLANCGSDSPTEAPADPNAQIVITSPLPGDVFYTGDSLRIKWKLQGNGLTDINSANIELSPDSGKTWIGLLNKSIGLDDPRWGNYAWLIPTDITHLGKTVSLSNDNVVLLKVMQYSTSDSNKIAILKLPITIKSR